MLRISWRPRALSRCSHLGDRARLIGDLTQTGEPCSREACSSCDRLPHVVQRAVQRGDLGHELVHLIFQRLDHLRWIDNMLSTVADVLAIHQLLSLQGHLVDSCEFDRFDELFTKDVVYDVSALGQGKIQGSEQFREISVAFVEDEQNPVGHHVTNVINDGPVGDTATVRSKGVAVLRDGRTGSLTYLDRVVRTVYGWRIAERCVVAAPS